MDTAYFLFKRDLIAFKFFPIHKRLKFGVSYIFTVYLKGNSGCHTVVGGFDSYFFAAFKVAVIKDDFSAKKPCTLNVFL